MLTKKELRKILIEKRKNLPIDYRYEADQQIFQKIINSDIYQKSNTIFCFVSTKEEINTRPILEHALNTEKCIVVPKCIEKGIMQAFQIQSFDDLKPGNYGILEPKEYCKYVQPTDIDLAIIPCLSCNSKGYRIGYGGGFYDRYIHNETFIKLAICYEKLICEDIPTDNWDEMVDILISA